MVRHVGSVADTLVPELNRYLPPELPLLSPVTNTMVECTSCRTHYLDPRLAPDGLDRVYEAWYRHAFPALHPTEAEQERFDEFSNYHLALLNSVAARRGSLLDVGSGSGIFVTVARRAGWDAEGLDFSAAGAEQAHKRYGIPIRVGTLADVDRAQRYDAITMFDYLEHTTTPGDDLDAAARLLAPGGLLAIRVPNRAGVQARLTGLNWIGVMSVHLCYFTGPILASALRARGLEVERIYSGNFQTLSSIVRRRAGWVRRRLVQRRGSEPAQGSSTLASPGGDPGSLTARNVGRLAWSMTLELIDHAGGWFGGGNATLIIARCRR